MTVRLELGDADRILVMKPSYPMPFWMTTCAAPISWATLGLTS